MELDRPHFRTTSTGGSSAATAAATTSELFICFTSRLSSSSSMKLSKSILSPGRAARDGAGGPSLSSSLSRRLRTNGSLKGGASPFLTTTGKKRGCAFENPEPSSPKVTCIGQVRVKTKKKVKQTRSLSRRRSGEVSFRKIEQSSVDGGDKVSGNAQQQRYSNASAHYQQTQQQQTQECIAAPPHRNQRWVHLPVSICEALREFSCLFPCKSSCFSHEEREKAEKQQSGGDENGCGAVFARWLVSLNDGEGGKKREIELVVGGGDEEELAAERISMRSSRRHVFEDIEVKDDRIEIKGQTVEGEEEAARVSICIPPKNALLLMRCRSDPMKMAALANKFSWDAHGGFKDENNEDGILEENNVEDSKVSEEEKVEVQVFEGKDEVLDGKDEVFEQDVSICEEANQQQEVPEEVEEAKSEMKVEEEKEEEEVDGDEEILENELVVVSREEMVEENETEELQKDIVVIDEIVVEDEADKEEEDEDEESNMSSFEALLEQENADNYQDCAIADEEEVENNSPICHLSPSIESDDEDDATNETPPFLEEAAMEKPEESNVADQDSNFENNGEENHVTSHIEPDPEIAAQEDSETTHFEDTKEEEDEEAPPPPAAESVTGNPKFQEMLTTNDEEPKKEKQGALLPDCLLLMMCEPKLSMEVSKETWVCSTDFVRWLPERPKKPAKAPAPKSAAGDHEPLIKRRLSIDSKPKPLPPPADLTQQPPRSSCSLPQADAAASMASMLEQKLVNAMGYEPFVLTRCKSEPMRTAAAKLMPESCFWKNAVRKMEPHRRPTLGVGAAGVGF